MFLSDVFLSSSCPLRFHEACIGFFGNRALVGAERAQKVWWMTVDSSNILLLMYVVGTVYFWRALGAPVEKEQLL